MFNDDDARDALEDALIHAYGEQSVLAVGEARRALTEDGEMFVDRNALSIQLIRSYCDAHLPDTSYDWLQHMHSKSNNPVIGFGEEDLARYQNPNLAARRFVIEHIYEILFPDQKGAFE